MNPRKNPSSEGNKSLFMMREFRLEPGWYQDKYPEAVLGIQSGRFQSYQEHYDVVGREKLCSPSPYFCSAFYERESKYRERQPAWGLVEDYFRYGAPNQISPHWLFNEKYFLEANAEVRKVVMAGNLVSGYQYYIRRVGVDQGISRPTPLFNKEYYLEQSRRKPVRDVFFDFITHGNALGVRCSPLFDPEWYCSRYPQVKALVGPFTSLQTYFQHYSEHGLREGKIPFPDFDVDYYLKENSDVEQGKASGVHPIQHFLFKGIREGRGPNRFFDTHYYLEHNPEVVKELKSSDFLGPFEHFLAVGIKRNLKACAPLISMAVSEDSAKALYEKRCRIQASMVKMGRHIDIPSTQNPTITAIIPVYNHFDFTINLLRQFELFTKANPANPIEIVVVDNGSTDTTTDLNKFVSGIKILRFETALGYPAACNAGACVAGGRWLLFLNNDIEIIPGSLERVIEVFGSAPDIGAVGGRIIKLNCEIQEAGGIVWNDGSTWGYGRGDDPLAPRFQFQRDVDYCSGCFLAVEADLFRELGEFDEQFSPGYYEETDLCARIWEAGRRVVYEPGIAIFHYEYASYGRGRPETIATGLIARNKDKFARKNRAFIAARPRFSPESAQMAANRAGRKIPRVLFIEDLMPRRELGSGFCRSEDIVKQFLDAGWWVNLWVNKKLPEIVPIESPLCEITYASEPHQGLASFLQTSSRAIDLIWLCRTHNLVGYADAISRWRADYPSGKVVCDTEAMASVRHWLTKELANGVNPELEAIEELIPLSQLERELKGHGVVDAFVAVSKLDGQLINLVTTTPVMILGHKIQIRPTQASFDERKGLLFCGAIHEEGSPNHDSLIWFTNRVVPLLRKRLPDVKLKIIGYWRPSIPIPPTLKDENVELIGPVDDLTPYFKQARVFIAPTRVAAGIPHKVHESMGFGLPTVITPILSSQLAGFGTDDDPAFFAAEDFSPGAFSNAVVTAYTDTERWEKVRVSALTALAKHCSAREFTESLDSILDSVLGRK